MPRIPPTTITARPKPKGHDSGRTPRPQRLCTKEYPHADTFQTGWSQREGHKQTLQLLDQPADHSMVRCHCLSLVPRDARAEPRLFAQKRNGTCRPSPAKRAAARSVHAFCGRAVRHDHERVADGACACDLAREDARGRCTRGEDASADEGERRIPARAASRHQAQHGGSEPLFARGLAARVHERAARCAGRVERAARQARQNRRRSRRRRVAGQSEGRAAVQFPVPPELRALPDLHADGEAHPGS